MVKVEKLTQSDTKKLNRNRIFRLIYDERAVSRQDIADRLNLSLPTVNQNIKELFDDGLVDYSGNFQSTGGRKAQAITVSSDIRFVISINIRNNYIRASLMNIYGEICCTREYEEPFSTSEKYRRFLGIIAREMADYAGCGDDDILGVGITVPGIIDKENGLIVFAPTLKIKDYPTDLITEFIDLKCHVENDAKAFAYTQMWKNREDGKKVCLLIDHGVGGAFISGLDTSENTHNETGEFGHMIIHPNGRLCNCGRKGCLEAYVSTSVLSDRLGIHIWEFFGRVGKNNEYNDVMEEYLDNLALGLNNILTMYDAPVVIGGEISRYLEPYMDRLKSCISGYDAGFIGDIDISLSSCGKQESLVGAALVYIDEFLGRV